MRGTDHWLKWNQTGSAAGKAITLILTLGLIGFGSWLVWQQFMAPSSSPETRSSQITDEAQGTNSGKPASENPSQTAVSPSPIEPLQGTPMLDAPAPYVPKNRIIDVDISEYAGYAGLIAANGGLEPNPDSFFAKTFGFQVRLSISEGENWSKLNNGQFAASATTTDVLAALGRSFQVTVPVQIGFSRGADMVVVDTGIASINQLRGRILAASQFNESEFFLRYLVQQAGLKVRVLRDLDSKPAPDEVGLVFYEDAFTACDAYASELTRKAPRLNGAVGWTPKTDEIVDASNGKAKILVSNRNLLIVSDILCVNRGFAEASPDMVRGLVHGVLEGNRMISEAPNDHIPVVAKAFGWAEAETRAELSRVHLSNLPENLAFFKGTIDAAGSFSSIYQSSVLAYGDLIRQPADSDRFMDMTHLDALDRAGHFAGQKLAIVPIRTSTREAIEGQALLSKDIRFFFEPNSAVLDNKAPENQTYLETIQKFLQVSPGSVVLLRGHVDNARISDFRREGGETLVQSMALKAMELSRQRAQAVRTMMLTKYPKIEASRIEIVGRGWEEPAGADSDLNRRVEVQWFTLE
ncbi:MAG: phosphate ABC transporter substrate-binding/OmpA family protein [Desulfatirhabdiaceae bacterium]